MAVYSGEGLRLRVKRIDGITSRRLSDGALAIPMHFQCPPLEGFRVEYSHGHSDYETMGKGQISRKGGRQLRTVSFDTVFVDWGSYTVAELPGDGDESPSQMSNAIERLIEIAESGEPIQLTCSHEGGSFASGKIYEAALTELDMRATMRSFSHEEKAGEGDARYLAMSFTEYVDPVATRNKLGSGKRWPKTHRLMTNDRLKDLAIQYYGNPAGWRVIAKANGFKFGQSSRIMKMTSRKLGAKITIPEPPKAQAKP